MSEERMVKALVFREIGTGEEVHRTPVDPPRGEYSRYIERATLGALTNMREDLYIDEDYVDPEMASG